VHKQNVFYSVTVQRRASLRNCATSYAERPFTGCTGSRDRQNPLSHDGQTRKRRRVRTPPVENVGRGRVVSSLHPRLQIYPNPNPYTGSVLMNRKNMPFCTNYFVQVISLKLDRRSQGAWGTSSQNI